jgi:formate dehydrogenase iron-sulfur subunit
MVEVETPSGRVAYGPVTQDDAESIVDAVLTDGMPRLRIGQTEAIPWLKRQTRLTFGRCGVIDPRSLEDYRIHGGYRGLERALALGPQGTIEEIVQSGLRGRGGAGFPTGIKWRRVAQTEAPQKYIVCNADEGDSGTFADRMIMEGDPFVLIEGMTVAALAVGATKGYVYIRSEYPHAIAAMKAAVETARRGAVLGRRIAGSAYTFDIDVRVGAGAYVCGEETSLLESIEGKRGVSEQSRRCRPTKDCSAVRPSSTTFCRSHRCRLFWQRALPSTATSGSGNPEAQCLSNSPETSSMAAYLRPPLASH